MKLFFLVFMGVCYLYASDIVVLADFETLAENKFPEGWGVKKGLWYVSGKGNSTWKIKKEKGNKFLSADSRQDSYTIGKKYFYSLKKFKFLRWRWRVHSLPSGADEEKKSSGDSAAGLYVIFPGFVVPYSIKYVWSTKRNVGLIVNSPFSSRTKIIVVRSGNKDLGLWVEEKRNVFEDFKRAFKTQKVSKDPSGIAVLTDSDNTGSSACADYDDIVALQN